jgi:integrase
MSERRKTATEERRNADMTTITRRKDSSVMSSPKPLPAGVSLRPTAHGGIHTFVRLRRKGRAASCTFADLKAALEWHAKLAAALETGAPLPPKPAGHEPKRRVDRPLTIAEACARWLRGAEEGEIRTRTSGGRRRYKERTLNGYAGHLRLHVLPEIGDWPVHALSYKDGRQLAARIHAETGWATATQSITALRAAFWWLLDEELLEGVNPLVGCPIPREEEEEEEPAEARILTPLELRTLYEAAEEEDRRLGRSATRVGLTLMASYSLRSSETRGFLLGPGGLDLLTKRITVTTNAGRVPGPNGYARGTPKTRAGKRWLPIAECDLELFRDHVMQLRDPAAGRPVLPSTKGDLRPTSFYNNVLRRVCVSAGIAVPHPTPHALRKCFETHAGAAGISPQAVAKLSGQTPSSFFGSTAPAATVDRYLLAYVKELESSSDVLAAWRAAECEREGARASLPHEWSHEHRAS